MAWASAQRNPDIRVHTPEVLSWVALHNKLHMVLHNWKCVFSWMVTQLEVYVFLDSVTINQQFFSSLLLRFGSASINHEQA